MPYSKCSPSGRKGSARHMDQIAALRHVVDYAGHSVASSCCRLVYEQFSSLLAMMNSNWPAPAESPVTLSADEVHVWAVPLDAATQPNSTAGAVLSHDERQRADEFRLDAPRRSFRDGSRRAADSARALSRHATRRRIELDRWTQRKAAAWPASTIASDLRFNVAHSGDLALVAVTCGCEVGVDVEQLAHSRPCRAHRATILSSGRNRDAILAAPPPTATRRSCDVGPARKPCSKRSAAESPARWQAFHVPIDDDFDAT